MQTQDTSTFIFLKLWPWVEANLKRIGVGVGIAVAIAILISFYIWQQNQKEIVAGEALTQLIVSSNPENAGKQADSYLAIANQYPGTLAAQRAQLQSAADLFDAGQYADAQTQFEKFLTAHPDGQFSGQAALGVAASLESLGKTNLAADAYRRVIDGFNDPLAADNAKFALAGINESEDKTSTALNLYEDVARNNPNNSLGSEAGLRAMALRAKLPAVSSASAPTNSFILSH